VRAKVEPGGVIEGSTLVPGDKSIAHRWLILAATARGTSRLVGLPLSLDVKATARCLSMLSPSARPALDAWTSAPSSQRQGQGFTWDSRESHGSNSGVELEGEGREGLVQPSSDLDCGNSGTTLRLLCGVLAGRALEVLLRGDESLSRRPMERVARPLRAMGAAVETVEGHPPVRIRGGALRGISEDLSSPSAQVKSAILLAGLVASGTTTVREPVRTRDHTERALRALGAPIELVEGGGVAVRAFQHDGFDASVPGDLSAAVFLVAAAALTGSELTVKDVGLNPTRMHALDVMRRMGVRLESTVHEERMGEPVGELRVIAGTQQLRPVEVRHQELPLVIDEVPVLAMLAAHASGDSRFLGAEELRVKEADRLEGIATGIRALGGHAAVDGSDLVIAGGGLRGGTADAMGDHRMAMAFAVAGLASAGTVDVEGMEAAAVSFPDFIATLERLGASIRAVS
jgi:3-phosphoshikimate 1-carboxyvinyltransferase